MLGYTLICDEMKDADIVALIKGLGYVEGLPVVVNPGILEPKAFIDEVVEQRLPNPFMPDAPQRIATDTSQKVGICFGETSSTCKASGMNAIRFCVRQPPAPRSAKKKLLARPVPKQPPCAPLLKLILHRNARKQSTT